MTRATYLLLLVAACGQAYGHEDGDNERHGDEHLRDEHHGDEHADDTAHLTVWSETLELFVDVSREAEVLPSPATLWAHLTCLEDFRPFEGSVRFALGEHRGQATMRSPGIYQIDVDALTEDAVLTLETELGTLRARLSDAESHEHDEQRIELTKEQQWSVRFGTTVATRGLLRPAVEVTGELQTPPSGTAHVHAPVPGRMEATRAGLPSPGDTVRRGQLLARLAPTPSSPEEAARAGLAVVDAEARVEAARIELERARRLLAQEAVPARRVQDAERGLRVAEAALSASRQARSLYQSAERGSGSGGWRLSAPIAGIVDSVHVATGEAVDAGELVFRIIDTSILWIHADVPEAWATGIDESGDAAFQLVGESQWRPLRLSGDAANARLVNVSRSVDARSRTVALVYELQGDATEDNALRVGAALRVAVPRGEATPAVTVPREAVLDAEARSVVVIQIEGELFEERSVRLGERDGERVAILAGITAGERVVSRGGQYVRLAGLGNASIGHGHVH